MRFYSVLAILAALCAMSPSAWAFGSKAPKILAFKLTFIPTCDEGRLRLGSALLFIETEDFNEGRAVDGTEVELRGTHVILRSQDGKSAVTLGSLYEQSLNCDVSATNEDLPNVLPIQI